jgi:transposase InsO family protein
MCEVLDVSESAFYEFLRTPEPKRPSQQLRLTRLIESIVLDSKRTYGSPRVLAVLKGMGIKCSKKRVAEILKDNGWNAKTKRKFKVTTDSDHKHQIVENLLDRNFNPSAANIAWAGDITYVRTAEGWLYLAIVMDLHSRRIVGWSMDSRMTRKLVIDAMSMALNARNPPRRLIFHSDKGSQYASSDFKRILWAAGAQQSMSGVGACWDNAVVESFFKTLKTEHVYHKTFATREAAKLSVFAWIEATYNRARLHSTLGYKTPVDFEEASMAQVA